MTVQEIEKAIEWLSLVDQLRLYRDMPRLIGRVPEDLEWQRLAIEEFFRDDAEDDALYDAIKSRRSRVGPISFHRYAGAETSVGLGARLRYK